MEQVAEPTEGERLRDFLEKATGGRHGWVTTVAAAAGVRRQTVYDWFTGKTSPTLGSLEAIAGAVGVRRYEIVSAMDGVGPVVPVQTLEEMVEALVERGLEQRLNSARDRRPA